ncbi:aldehyde dehydrogenase [Halobacillus salinarum]|uniref:Aldehyde dehydrogenase n=1 Tax=Halobacillus salinarum TaxID=2932257 RepID=A0ABY4EG85_9BACI|nr:aldehyde dehydrogenase [Halobacillus salinarum]UOQ42629.1 aldehyde dehydrogenase [Halobacillus salinarum]
MENLVKLQKQWFEEGHTRSYDFRRKQLKRFKQMLITFEKPILRALRYDLSKSEYEAYAGEIAVLKNEINEQLKHIKQWMKPEKVKAPFTHIGSRNYILKDPYGLVLVIAPWNYPLQLSLAPVIGAIAAGNTIILKPSEVTPTVSWVLKKMINQYFKEEYIAVVEGGKEVTEQLMMQPLDYVFFTGSTSVGKKILAQASSRLIPVTLELGGKSPAIVHKDAVLHLAAKRIVWGKFTNAGQTCIAPDYLLVHHTIKNELLAHIKSYIQMFYGDQPVKNGKYVKIVNDHHYKRLKKHLIASEIIYGGEVHDGNQKIEPSILDGLNSHEALKEEEIFGPLLPVFTFSSLEEAVSMVKAKPKPLALYYFGENKEEQMFITTSLSFGGGCINDTLYHTLNPHLPFGGIGESGIGMYHGQASFETFTHTKSITNQSTKFDHRFRYPDSKTGLFFIKKILG